MTTTPLKRENEFMTNSPRPRRQSRKIEKARKAAEVEARRQATAAIVNARFAAHAAA